MPMLNFRVTYPAHLIDLNGVDGLSYINEEENDIVIGAMTPQRSIEFSEVISRRLPLMSEAILSVGHRQTRNRGTIGGSLCHLDPSAELPLVAAAFDAIVVVAGNDRVRDIEMADFAATFMTPAIDHDEIVTHIRLTPWREGHGWAFIEFARRKGDFAIVAVAVMLDLGPGGSITRVSVALGGVGPGPLRMKAAEKILVGNVPSEELLDRAAACCNEIDPLEDPFIPTWYRRTLAQKLSRRALAIAVQRARGL